MSEDKIELLPFKQEVKDIFDYPETRYRFVNTETGEIVDDAQGYGYKDKQKAWKAFAYKKGKNKIDDSYKKFESFVKEHSSLLKECNSVFDYIEPDADYDAEFWSVFEKSKPEIYKTLSKQDKKRIIEIVSYDGKYKNYKKGRSKK